MARRDDAPGDCYPAAARCFLDLGAELPPGSMLVHGWPTLTRPPFVEFGHAWIEFERDGIAWCLNVANGKRIEIPAALFYSAGQVDPDRCARYHSADEVRAKLVEFAHWGPWV